MLLIEGLVVILCFAGFLSWAFISSTSAQESSKMSAELHLIVQGVAWAGSDRAAYIKTLGASGDSEDFRVTWIAADGQVLYDSDVADVSTMQNHSNRPEVIAALATGQGEARRYSATLAEVMQYQAVRLDDGTVLRISRAEASIFASFLRYLAPGVAVLLAIIAGTALVSRLLARRTLAPINALDLDAPAASPVYSELQPLLARMQRQRQELEQQAGELARSRRDFTANVSHELKTPLTVIGGYAELMRDGQVAPQDTQRIAGLVYDEAKQIRELVDDILVLSQLDDRESPHALEESETVDLLPLSERLIERLRPFALQNQVVLRLEHSGDLRLQGSPRVLTSVVYNLCENAIRYNRPGGRVLITLTGHEASVDLTVSDDGAGIPKEDQQHVFERFFRVDKTRSRTTGGTGLGLAIVKNGAEYHGATLTLESQVGEGTTISLSFPR